MPELIVLDRILQLGPESVANTVVPATKQFATYKLLPSIKASGTPFMGQGQKLTNTMTLGKEWSEGALTFQPSYGEIVYALSGLLGGATITTPALGFRSRLWTWNELGSVGDTPKTFSVETGDAVGAETFGGGVFNALSLHFARDTVSGSGNLFGQKTNAAGTLTALTATSAIQSVVATGATSGTFTLGFGTTTVTSAIQWNSTAAALQTILNTTFGAGNITATGGPLPATPITLTFGGIFGNQPFAILTANNASLVGGTAVVTLPTPGVAITPEPSGVQVIVPNTIDLFIDPTSGAFGTTRFLRSFTYDFSMTDKYQSEWPINSTLPSYATATEKAPKAEVKISLASDTQGVSLLTALRAGTTQYVRLLCTGPVIEGALTFSFTLDTAIKIRDAGPVRDFQGIYTREFTADIVQDYSWGQAMKVVVQNMVTAL